MSTVRGASGSFQAFLDQCASSCEQRLVPMGRPSSLAVEVGSSSLPPLPADAIDAMQAFEAHLMRARDAPLPAESEEERRLVRILYAKRLCALVYRTANQAIALEENTAPGPGRGGDIQVRQCDLLMRPRVPLNNSSQWGSLTDEQVASVNKSTSKDYFWNGIFQFLQTTLQDSFHLVYIIITDQMIQNESQWINQFLEWCFVSGEQFHSQSTNLIIVPWFKTTIIKIPDSIRRLSIESIGTSTSSATITIGEIIRRIIVHRFLLLQSLFVHHIQRAFSSDIPDLAEYCYMTQFESLFKDALLNSTGAGNPDTDLSVLEELLFCIYPYRQRAIEVFTWVMRSPKRWTRDSIQLEAGQSVWELYMNTLYFGRAKSFGRCRLNSLYSAVGVSGGVVLVQQERLEAYVRRTLRGLKRALQNVLKNPEEESPCVYQLITFVCPFRCIRYLTLYQEPSSELLDIIQCDIQLCPKLIMSLIHSHENYCCIIEIIILELLYCELQLFSILSSKNNLSRVVGFSWNLLKTIANVIEATALLIMRFNTLDTKHFKGEFVASILKVLGEVLKRASEVLTDGVCTEPNPEETFNRLEECVIKLDFDHWYSRIHDWSIGPSNFYHGSNYIVLDVPSLKHLADVCKALEKRFRCTLIKQSQSNSDGSAKRAVRCTSLYTLSCVRRPTNPALEQRLAGEVPVNRQTSGEFDQAAIQFAAGRIPNLPVADNDEHSEELHWSSGSSASSTLSNMAMPASESLLFHVEVVDLASLFEPESNIRLSVQSPDVLNSS